MPNRLPSVSVAEASQPTPGPAILHATLRHALGLDHRRLTYPHDGRNDGLTDADVTGARVVPELLA